LVQEAEAFGAKLLLKPLDASRHDGVTFAAQLQQLHGNARRTASEPTAWILSPLRRDDLPHLGLFGP